MKSRLILWAAMLMMAAPAAQAEDTANELADIAAYILSLKK